MPLLAPLGSSLELEDREDRVARAVVSPHWVHHAAEAQCRVEQLTNQTLLTNYDRTHVLSLVLGYDFGSGYRVGARGYWASGRMYTTSCPNPDCAPGDVPVNGADGTDAGGAPDPAVYLHRGRTPPFARVDLRFEKRWELPAGAWLTATVEWFKALLATEAQYAYYTPQGLKFYRRSALTLPSVGVEFGY